MERKGTYGIGPPGNPYLLKNTFPRTICDFPGASQGLDSWDSLGGFEGVPRKETPWRGTTSSGLPFL